MKHRASRSLAAGLDQPANLPVYQYGHDEWGGPNILPIGADNPISANALVVRISLIRVFGCIRIDHHFRLVNHRIATDEFRVLCVDRGANRRFRVTLDKLNDPRQSRGLTLPSYW